MMIDLTQEVETIDGRPARILCVDRSFGEGETREKFGRYPSYRVVALVMGNVGKVPVELVKLYTLDGETSCGHDPEGENWNDKLINVDRLGPVIARNMRLVL